MDKGILYFGYGANRDPKMMQAITGTQKLAGLPAVLKDFALCIQRLDQIPDIIAPNSPLPISPRSLLKESWPKTFESYVIKSNKNNEVYGTLWNLNPLERALVKEWELVEFGWYKDLKIKVKTMDGKEIEAETEGLRENQEIDRQVNGKNYETWLNRLEDFQRIAEKARKEYFKRLEKSRVSSKNNL